MKHERAFDLLTIFTALTSITLYASAAESMAVFLLGTVGLIAARLITGPLRSERMWPTWIVTLLVAGSVSFYVMRGWAGRIDIDLFSQFMLSLLVIKTLDRRRARDAAQLISLSVFLGIGAMLTSATVWVGLLLVALLPLIIATTLLYQMIAAGQQTPQSDLAAVGRGMRRSIVRLTGVSLVLGLFGAAIVFVLMPRGLGQSVLGGLGATGVGRVSAFTDEVNLGTGGLISTSPMPVLDLEVFGRNGEQLGMPGRVWYLRGAVLDEYHEGSWRSAANPMFDERIVLDPGSSWIVSRSVNQPRVEWTAEQRITLRNTTGKRTPLFGSWEPIEVRVDRPAHLRVVAEGSVLQLIGHKGGLSYTIRSRVTLYGDEDRLLPLEQRRFIPRFPDEQIAAITRSILEQSGIEPDPSVRTLGDDPAAARSIERYLHGEFSYTLSPQSVPPGRDPIEWFLTDARSGHCEYFASAMTAMCRSVGVPARVVTGYVATDFNDLTSSYVVRQSNAHAWVEVQVVPPRFDESTGRVRTPGVWRVFDPTPPAEFRSLHQPPPTLWTRVSHMIDSIEYAWIRHVVTYDTETQTRLLGGFAGVGFVQAIDNRIARSIRHSDPRGGLRVAAWVFAGGLVGLGVWWFLWRVVLGRIISAWRRWRLRSVPVGARRGTREELDRLHAWLLDVLARMDRPKPRWSPLRAHVRSTFAAGRLSDELGSLSATLDRARFGITPLSRDEIDTVRSRISSLEQSIRTGSG